MSKKSKTSKPYNGRDLLKLKLIQGATKANVSLDKKKQSDKDKCRKSKGDHNGSDQDYD